MDIVLKKSGCYTVVKRDKGESNYAGKFAFRCCERNYHTENRL